MQRQTPHWSWPKVVGISGYSRVGKDTAGEVFTAHGYTRVALADPIRDFLYEIDPRLSDGSLLSTWIDNLGWEATKERCPEVVDLMVKVGSTARHQWGEDFWVERAVASAPEHVVFTDIRFTNEADYLRHWANRVAILRVHRPGFGPRSHFELDVDNIIPDMSVANDGTIEEFKFEVEYQFMDWMSCNPTHIGFPSRR